MIWLLPKNYCSCCSLSHHNNIQGVYNYGIYIYYSTVCAWCMYCIMWASCLTIQYMKHVLSRLHVQSHPSTLFQVHLSSFKIILTLLLFTVLFIYRSFIFRKTFSEKTVWASQELLSRERQPQWVQLSVDFTSKHRGKRHIQLQHIGLPVIELTSIYCRNSVWCVYFREQTVYRAVHFSGEPLLLKIEWIFSIIKTAGSVWAHIGLYLVPRVIKSLDVLWMIATINTHIL